MMHMSEDLSGLVKMAREEARKNHPVPYILSYDECEKLLLDLAPIAPKGGLMKIQQNLLTSESWSEKETENVKLISEFVQALMINHEADRVISEYDNSDYIQHNRNIPDGLTGIANFVRQFAKQFPDFTYEVKKIIADGDSVIFHSHATVKKADRGNDNKGLNITDIWRLEEGKIVEHWDSIQAIDFSMRLYALLNGGKIRNTNGVF